MTTVEHHAFASPLDLLRQWGEQVDRPPLRELLVLGFTVDLAFLERFCVPLARQLGARVTVLGDAAQSVHDAVDVRFAGRTYQHGLAVVPGAFHPKLAVLLGEEHLWAAVGSGNPTMSGWGHNRELWWVLRGRTDRGPRAQADLGTWLTELVAHVPMPSWIAATVDGVGRRVVPREVDGTHADVRVLHNLHEPLIDQIPRDPVDELRLAAPFLDPSGRAVRAVLDRFRPRSLTVGLQPQLTSYGGPMLVDATARVGEVQFRALDESRTLHGKLVEWTTGDGRWTALVGSANITTPALLRTVGDAGNCELAVQSPTPASLLPPAALLAPADVATHVFRPEPDDDRAPGLRLLGCRRHDDGLTIEFVAAHAVDVTVETSVDGAPGSWQPRATAPASRVDVGAPTSVKVVAPEAAGSVVRLVAFVDGVRVESAPVFVTDTARCRPRSDDDGAPRMPRPYELEAVFTDAVLAARFDADLRRLLDLSARHRAASVPTVRTSATDTDGNDEDRWLRFLDEVTRAVGPSLTDLVFPGALPSAFPLGAAGSAARWTVADVTDTDDEPVDDGTEDTEDEELAVRRVAVVVPPDERARYRSWARRWVAAVAHRPAPRGGPAPPQPALVLRMTVVALYLELLAAGVWRGDESWRDDLADLVVALVADPDEVATTPPDGCGHLNLQVAVSLAVLLHDAQLHGGSPADVAAQRAWEAGHARVADADDALLDALLLTSTQPGARLAARSEVDRVVALARAAQADPFAEPKAGFAAEGIEVGQYDGVWVLRGSFRNTRRVAARAVTELVTAQGVVAVATNGTQTTVMLRRGAALHVADTTARHWRSFQLRPPLRPQSLFTGDEGMPKGRSTAPLSPLPVAVRELGDAVGVNVAQLVHVFLPAPPPRRR